MTRLPRSLPPLLLLCLLAACTARGGGGDDDDATDNSSWNVEIVNSTSTTLDTLHQRPCPSEDEADWSAISVNPALAPGDSMRTWLPQPGCFDLRASGGGCTAEGTTDPMQQGDTVTWTIDDADLGCAG